jgi:hypothetical protein
VRRRSRQSTSLLDTAGVYHVASRLAYEGFRDALAWGAGAGAEILAGLLRGSVSASLWVRATECPSSFRSGRQAKEGGEDLSCEWRLGKEAAVADQPGSFVALVDLGDVEKQPGVWMIPSARIRMHFSSLEEPRPWHYRVSVEQLAPYENNWDVIEDHLLEESSSRTGWFTREELEERYGEEFVQALDAEALRLLAAQNSTIRKMADERFPAEELADVSALLSTLFRWWMEGERQRRMQG